MNEEEIIKKVQEFLDRHLKGERPPQEVCVDMAKAALVVLNNPEIRRDLAGSYLDPGANYRAALFGLSAFMAIAEKK